MVSFILIFVVTVKYIMDYVQGQYIRVCPKVDIIRLVPVEFVPLINVFMKIGLLNH